MDWKLWHLRCSGDQISHSTKYRWCSMLPSCHNQQAVSTQQRNSHIQKKFPSCTTCLWRFIGTVFSVCWVGCTLQWQNNCCVHHLFKPKHHSTINKLDGVLGRWVGSQSTVPGEEKQASFLVTWPTELCAGCHAVSSLHLALPLLIVLLLPWLPPRHVCTVA